MGQFLLVGRGPRPAAASRRSIRPTGRRPPARRPAQVTGTINDKNGLNVHTGAGQVTVWLSPKMLDFNQRAIITVNGRRINGPDQMIQPDLHVLLEDVRTRGDRQHPFWARIESSTGRVHGE